MENQTAPLPSSSGENPTGSQSVREKPDRDGANPIVAIGIAILTALTLSGISFLVFLNSDTRNTIRTLQEEEDKSDIVLQLPSEPDENSSLNQEQLDEIEDAISAAAETVRADEFNQAELTNQNLGL